MKPQFRIMEGKKNEAPNFDLTVLELKDYIGPEFGEIKRIYWLNEFRKEYNAGGHCHKVENELIILVKGACTAEINYGSGLQTIKMMPGAVFSIGNYVWHYFRDFSEDAVLLCVASTNYNPNRSDYISDYQEFCKLIEQ